MSGVIVVVLALMALQGAKDDISKQDREKLQGTWRAVSAEHDGRQEPLPTGGLRWVIRAERCEIHMGKDKAETQELVLDAGQKPKTIEARPSGGLIGHRLKGIYELDGDTFKVCYDLTGKNYPKEFSAPKGARRVSYVLKREP